MHNEIDVMFELSDAVQEPLESYDAVAQFDAVTQFDAVAQLRCRTQLRRRG
jgi:hypothetical protein